MSTRIEILRVSGTREIHTVTAPSVLDWIEQALGAESLGAVDFHDGSVMFVDGRGLVDSKPVNEQATKLYHEVDGDSPICGDVAIVLDVDFK